MKPLLFILFVISFYSCFSQDKEFFIQGRLVDSKQNPIADAYIINLRSSEKSTSRDNGVFDVLVLPGDSLIISHVSYFRKVISAFQLMANPNVQLELDTINIMQIDVSPDQKTDAEKAEENIKNIEFDFRPQPFDSYTESERMGELLNKENRVERAAASSLHYQFSPSQIIGKISEKIKKRKKANQYQSTKKPYSKKKKNYQSKSD